MKLKHKQIPEQRSRRLKKQRSKCPLCKRYIRKDQATMDHDHATGRLRMVLHRNCNSVEGRVLHWARRSGIAPEKYLRALLEYWEQDYSSNPLHPTHGKKRKRRRRKKK